MIPPPVLGRDAASWIYRALWAVAILLVGAMPLVILARGEVWVGPASFDETRRLTHSLIVVGGDVSARAGVDYPLVVILGNVRIEGTIQDDLVTVGGNVFLDRHAVVEGALVTLIGQVYRAPGAVIQGTVGASVHEWTDQVPPNPPLDQVDLLRQVRLGLATGFGLLLICLVVAATLPWSIVVTAATARRYPIRSALAAITGVVVVPLLLLPLVLSLVGLPLAIVLSFGALVVWLVGLTAAGYLIGRRLLGDQRSKRGFLPVLVAGLAPVLLALAVPVIGPVLVGSIGLLGAGARIVSFVEHARVDEALQAIARNG